MPGCLRRPAGARRTRKLNSSFTHQPNGTTALRRHPRWGLRQGSRDSKLHGDTRGTLDLGWTREALLCGGRSRVLCPGERE